MSKKNVSSNTVIEVKNLYKKYDNFVAVNDISFRVFEGEIFGLLGPNGAGKSTTLEIIETLRDETSGDVTVYDYSINNNPQQIKEIIGVQLQKSGFYPNLNLKELIDMFAGMYGVNVDVDDMLSKVKLVDKKKSLVKELSGGQQQRFSIATTLINSPKLVFLDEPTTGLDPQARRNLWELIKTIRDDGATVVLTTHYMEEAEYLCDRVGIMDQGEIVAIDTPEQLIQNLLEKGFEREEDVKAATLEDVFIDLTGKELRE
jgi:ABC-2 type transport system ATP-binding protein